MNRAAPAVLLIAAVVVAAGCGAAHVGPIARASSHPSEKFQAPEVQVVAYSSADVRVCPPYATATAAATGPVSWSGKPQPPFCKDGLRATGVDMRALTTHAN